MRITSSSISSSDEVPGRPNPWRRFASAFVLGAAVLLIGILGAAYAIDPYDTGRSSLLKKPGVRPQGPRTANASRGRDPAFNAAVIGNSHVQLLSPERLGALTGLSFVQLTIPATRPKEQFAVIGLFMRHHPDARALVIGADNHWCTPDPAIPIEKPFPFWLYSESHFEYLRGLLRYQVVEELPKHLRYASSMRAARARPDGYWDYGPLFAAVEEEPEPVLRARLDRRLTENYTGNATGRFPVADRFRQVLSTLPRSLAVVLVFPPVYASLLSAPGSPGESADRACKAALAEALSSRPAGVVVDWRYDRPELHEPALFYDHSHYRRALAELVEKDVARALEQAVGKGR
jgi:hypothetical protein